MPIRYLPNDPTSGFQQRVGEKSPTRSGGTVGFTLPPGPPEQVYPENDAAFTYWQARESALQALRVWDDIGGPLGGWQHGARRLALNPVQGLGLQASYDRSSLDFNRWDGDGSFYVGSSADAVIHEVGHALLDAIRPDLWHSIYPEIVAFHEAFADCLCLFSCLLDDAQRGELLAAAPDPSAVLSQSGPVSRIAESIASNYGSAFSASDPSATARDANNDLQWDFAHRLPSLVVNGDLSSEPHSFSRVFTGCIYDCINNLYTAGPAGDGGLRQATRTVASLLTEATRNAPEGVEFFRRVGQAMVLADRNRYGGAHQHHIGRAFAGHGITLGSSSLITPAMPLAGSARSDGPVGLTTTARKDLARRLNLGDALWINYRPVRLGGRRLVEAQCHRSLELGRFNPRFRNVSVRIADSVLYDVDGATPRVMDAVPLQSVCEEHAAALATTLMDNALLMRDRKLLGADGAAQALPAYSVRRQHGRDTLTRVRCVCHTRPGH